MVDFYLTLLNNNVSCSNGIAILPRTAAFSESTLPPDNFLAHVRKNNPAPIDFRLPPLDEANKRIILLIGFSFAMSLLLTGTAFATVSLSLKLASIF